MAARMAAGPDVLERLSALRENIGATTSLRPADTPKGRALVTTKDSAAQARLFAVPLTNVLCITDEPQEGETALGRAALAAWEEAHGKVPGLLRELILGTLPAADSRWDMRLLAWLLWLSQNAEGTVWKEYCTLLPKENQCSLLLSYHGWERDELQKPALMREAFEQRAEADYYHVTMAKLGFTSRDKPLETYRALAAVRSRAFSVRVDNEDLTLLVPYADLANHSHHPDVRFDYDEASRQFELRSLTALKAGTEVHISYGNGRDSHELMRDYGFILEDNLDDRVAFSSSGFGRSILLGPVRGPKLQPKVLIRALGLDAEVKEGELVMKHPPADVAAVRRHCALYSLPLVGSVGQLPIPSLPGAGPLSFAIPGGVSPLKEHLTEAEVKAEREAVRQLRAEAAQQLTSCGTTAEQDEALLQDAIEADDDSKLPTVGGYLKGGDPEDGLRICAIRLRAAIRARLHWKQLVLEAISVLDEYDANLASGSAK